MVINIRVIPRNIQRFLLRCNKIVSQLKYLHQMASSA